MITKLIRTDCILVSKRNKTSKEKNICEQSSKPTLTRTTKRKEKKRKQKINTPFLPTPIPHGYYLLIAIRIYLPRPDVKV